MPKQEETSKVRVFALGGLGETGKNMYVVEVNDEIIVLDAGQMIPEDDMLGVDIVIADISYLVQNSDRVKGIILSHGHEDHCGALPYVLRKLQVPVYGTKLTLGLIEEELKAQHLRKKTDLKTISSGDKVKIGNVKVEFFRVSHSIPDCVGVAIETPQGYVVYTGDFKFDQTPADNKFANIGKMTQYGKKGVLCLLSDSTNAEIPGTTPSEKETEAGMKTVFREAPGRVIVSTYASNIYRIQQAIDAAKETNRKVSVVGDSMRKNIQIAKRLGYLRVPKQLMVSVDELSKHKGENIAILSTGSQGEPTSGLHRMAKGTDRQLSIMPKDTVVISASPTPGKEKSIGRVVDFLYRVGAEVVHADKNVNVSGHASQEELMLMLNLMKPRHFVPIQGEYRMQIAHGNLAKTTGVHPERIHLMQNGEVLHLEEKNATKSTKVQAGNVLVDGLGIGDVGNIVLRDRRLLSKDGILVVVVTLNKKTNAFVSGPDIISRGFVYVRESEELLDEAKQKVTETLRECMEDNVNEWSSLKSNVRDVLSRFLFDKTKRRPMILPIIMEV
ncbi:ribonuclease J [Salicibibacter halophilus]|uniref:Ribonuclease J n=1 Tax=Salicibibacter halophilus TaxID=2502791 RepID=A0A514LF63_9BACI|nr:ribonuclease J [Salicibibacter halophilus]QDI90195.1 ribonuclease J [Salicibibacter halophilus]